ncbi:MAG: hypothetical protein ABL984_08370 [Pyrinomonadaceae bacterium]
MSRVHLVFGLLLFVVFLVTGQYMRADFPDKEAIDQTLRVLMRSRHIYILFSAMIHIGLGLYFTSRFETWRKALQYAGSAVLMASSILLVIAFVQETYEFGAFSELSRYGIYTSLAGIGLHLIAAVRDQLRSSS